MHESTMARDEQSTEPLRRRHRHSHRDEARAVISSNLDRRSV